MWVLGKLVPLCQLIIPVKPTGNSQSFHSWRSSRGKVAYHYYQLLPHLSLLEVVVDLEVTVLLMNCLDANQSYRISLLPYASKQIGRNYTRKCCHETINSINFVPLCLCTGRFLTGQTDSRFFQWSQWPIWVSSSTHWIYCLKAPRILSFLSPKCLP